MAIPAWRIEMQALREAEIRRLRIRAAALEASGAVDAARTLRSIAHQKGR